MSRRARAQRVLTPIFAAALTALLASIAVFGGAAPAAQAAIQDPFAKVFSVNANGDIGIIGNTLETCNPSTANGITNGATCAGDRAATGTTTNGFNNNHTMQFVDVDGVAGTFNSSSANLTLPTDGTVLFAALVWSGRTAATAATNADPALRANVKFTVPNGAGSTTTDIVGSVAGNTTTTSRFYQGYKDVTALVSAAGSGTYTLANVQSETANVDKYAGWALVVAYGDPNAPKRNLTVFKGLADLSTTAGNTTQDFTVSGFLTPPQGTVHTTVGVVAYEGDRNYVGDSMTINGFAISDAANPNDNVFNSTITTKGVDLGGRNPNYANQLGFDADLFDAPAGAIGNSATSAAIRLTTAQETYYPGIVTFATELYDPKLNASKSSLLKTDADNSGSVTRGDTLEYTVDVQNDGLDTATDSVFFDAIPTGTTYVPGTLTIDGVGQSDSSGNDQGDYDSTGANGHVIARLGTGATATNGGEINTVTGTPAGPKHTVKFSVIVNGTAVPGQGLVNAANIAYAGKTTGARAASVSNVVTEVIPPVQAVNQPPVAPGRSLSITPSAATPNLSVNVLGLASDPEGNPLTLVGVTDAAGGTVTVANGVATYTPGPTFAGRDVFTYTVQDSFGNRSTGVIRIDVINTPPVAVDDARTISHLAPTTLALVANDTDDNGDALSVRSITANGSLPVTSGSITTSKGGTLTIANGVVTYTPPAGGLALGQTEAFTYVVQDARGGSDDASVVLTSANSGPTAVNDTARANGGTQTAISPLVNDTDPDGDPLTITAASTTGANAGTVTFTGTQLQYTPKPGFSGTDVITYTISDGQGGTSTATVTVTINQPPVAVDDAITRPGDTAATINVLANDTDPNGDTLTLSSIALTAGDASKGTVNYIAGGAGDVTFTPAPGFVGQATLDYTVSDGLLTDAGQLVVTISNIVPTVPTPPTAVATGTDVPVTVDVKQYVSDANVAGGYQTLSTTAVTVSNGATRVINSDGTVTVTPAAGYTGPITVTFTVSDGTAAVTSTVTVNVSDAPPTAQADQASTQRGTAVDIDVLVNDTDPNGNGTISIQSVQPPQDANGTTRGTTTIVNGKVRYTPPAGFAGTVTFDYTITDGTTTSTATVTVVVNAPPTAVNDVVRIPMDAPVTISPLANDSDADGGTLAITAASATGPNAGTVTFTGTQLQYTPKPGYVGTDVISYTISDGQGGTSSATVTVTVNGPPVAVADSTTTPGNTPATVDVLGNDTDPNGDTLTVTTVGTPSAGTGTIAFAPGGNVTFTPAAGYVGTQTLPYTITDGLLTSSSTVAVTVSNIAPTVPNPATTVTTPTNTPVVVDVKQNVSDPNVAAGLQTLTTTAASASNGATTVIQPNGTVTVTPATGYTGPVTLTYTVSDGIASVTSTVTVNVSNAAPTAVDDSAATRESTSVLVNVLANDTDPNGNGTVSIQGFTAPTDANGTTRGTVALENGQLRYTPPTGFGGTVTFGYTITDGTSTASATVTVTVNSAPVARNDVARTDRNTPATISPLSNDTDADGDPLTVSSATTTGPNAGTVTINPDGTLAYTPKPGYVGTDVITYAVSDGSGNSSSATVTVTVNGPPVANPDAITTPGNTPVSIDVTTNDTDPNGDTLTVTAVGTPVAGTGTVGFVPGGTVTFTPANGYVGTSTLSYTVTDGLQTATSTVAFTVSNVAPTVPTAAAAAGTGTNTPVTVNVQQNVSDPNVSAGFQTLTTTAASASNGATTTINADGTVTITPATGYTGPVTVTYTVSDGTASVTSTVTINVADGAPTAAPDSATTPTDTSALVDVLDNDSDPNGSSTLSIQSVTAPTDGGGTPRGTTVIENGQVRYTPPTGFSGTVSFGYTITDGTTPTSSTVTVTVSNAAPVATSDTATTPSGTAAVVDVLGNDTDANIPGTTQVLAVTTAVADSGATVTIGTDGRLTVSPVAGFAGPVTVTYTITDGATGTATGTLVVTVQNAPPAPIADTGVSANGGPVTLSLLGNDTDPNGDTLTVTSFTQAVDANSVVRGTVTVDALGVATITPQAGYVGTLAFSYTVTDGHGGTATANVSISVSAPVVTPAQSGGSGTTGAGANGLALTGASPAPWLVLSLGLLLIGIALRVRSHRGRHTAR